MSPAAIQILILGPDVTLCLTAYVGLVTLPAADWAIVGVHRVFCIMMSFCVFW